MAKPKSSWKFGLAASSLALVAGATLSLRSDSASARETPSFTDSLGELFELPVVHAAAPGGPDSDGDGLADTLEEVIGTATMRADSDGDGYWDAEELARQSDPLDKLEIPKVAPASCGLGIYETGGNLRPVFAMYVEDGDIRSATLTAGARVKSTLRPLSLSFFMTNSSIVKTPTVEPQSAVYVYDGTFNPQYVHRFGDLSLYTTIDYGGSVVQADAVNLGVVGGVVVEFKLISYSTTMGAQPSYVFGQGSNTVYSPIGGSTGTPPPSSWSSNRICSQQMVVSGVNGPVVTQEVAAAECESGWSSYCGSECAASVGSSVQMLDPIALIGG